MPDRAAVPLKVGDTVRVPGVAWLKGAELRVIGLRVRSCRGFVGVAVQYSARAYLVVRPCEVQRA